MNKRRWTILLSCNALAIALYFSWLPTQTTTKLKDGDTHLLYKSESSLWKSVDLYVFRLFNSTLKDSKSAQSFWAFTNKRVFDLASAFLMIFTYTVFIFRGRSYEEKVHRVKVGLYMSLCTIVALGLVKVFQETYDKGRLSPTKSKVEGAILLSKFDHIGFEVKDSSRDSFPGDHAVVLFVVATFICYYARGLFAATSIIIALLFVLPRIVVGGHWLTDIVIGGSVFTLIIASFALGTPLKEKFESVLNKPALFIVRIAAKFIPALRPPVQPDA